MTYALPGSEQAQVEQVTLLAIQPASSQTELSRRPTPGVQLSLRTLADHSARSTGCVGFSVRACSTSCTAASVGKTAELDCYCHASGSRRRDTTRQA